MRWRSCWARPRSMPRSPPEPSNSACAAIAAAWFPPAEGATERRRLRYLVGNFGRQTMADKQKPHDLRDDTYAPRTTITNTDERLAGAEPATLDPANEDVGGILR